MIYRTLLSFGFQPQRGILRWNFLSDDFSVKLTIFLNCVVTYKDTVENTSNLQVVKQEIHDETKKLCQSPECKVDRNN